MLVCPKCKSEYREGYTICSECKCELIKIPEVVKEDRPVKKDSKIIQLIIGSLLILFSPILSYEFTSLFFNPNGANGYNNNQFMWMLKAYNFSFVFIGIIICLPHAFYLYKNHKSNY